MIEKQDENLIKFLKELITDPRLFEDYTSLMKDTKNKKGLENFLIKRQLKKEVIDYFVNRDLVSLKKYLHNQQEQGPTPLAIVVFLWIPEK